MWQVISGGQTGVDITALRAAKAVGLRTTGFIPKGFRTEAGPKPQYADLYGLIETESSDYPERTFKNVQHASATFLFAVDLRSPGTKRALAACEELQLPCYMYQVEVSEVWGEPVLLHEQAIHGNSRSLEQTSWRDVAGQMAQYESVNIGGNRDAYLEKFLLPFFVTAFMHAVYGDF